MGREKGRQRKTRMVFELSLELRERIERLQDRTGADSMTEVIRRALLAYDIFCAAEEAGKDVWIAAKGGPKERVLLA